MSISDHSSEQTVAHPYDLLYVTALEFKRINAMLLDVPPKNPDLDSISQLRNQQQASAEQLWNLLKSPLLGVAGRWSDRSGMARDMQPQHNPSYKTRHDVQLALAMHAFGSILDALPRLRIKAPERLLRCLMTIARRSLAREHYRIYCRHRREMGPTSAITDDILADEFADPDSDKLYEHVIESMTDSVYVANIRQFWEQTVVLQS